MPATSVNQPSAVPPPRASRDVEFAALALPLLPRVTRIARALARDSADGDDAVQETFLRAYRYWHTFDPATDCGAWLTTICRRVLFDHRRRSAGTDVVDDAELESLAAARLHKTASAAGLDDLFERVDLGPAIHGAIARLDEPFRDVVRLSDVEGFSYEEIAALLDIPIGTVRSRLYRGRRHLQQALIAFAIDAGYSSAQPRETP